MPTQERAKEIETRIAELRKQQFEADEKHQTEVESANQPGVKALDWFAMKKQHVERTNERLDEVQKLIEEGSKL